MQKSPASPRYPTPQKLPKRGLEDIFPTPTVLLKDICPKFPFEFAEITGKQLRCPGWLCKPTKAAVLSTQKVSAFISHIEVLTKWFWEFLDFYRTKLSTCCMKFLEAPCEGTMQGCSFVWKSQKAPLDRYSRYSPTACDDVGCSQVTKCDLLMHDALQIVDRKSLGGITWSLGWLGMESSRRHENEHRLPISPEVTAAFAPFELGSVRQMFPCIILYLHMAKPRVFWQKVCHICPSLIISFRH